jgi:hypothetical protein
MSAIDSALMNAWSRFFFIALFFDSIVTGLYFPDGIRWSLADGKRGFVKIEDACRNPICGKNW